MGWNYLGDNHLFSSTVKLSRISGIQDQKTKCCYCLYLEQHKSFLGIQKMHSSNGTEINMLWYFNYDSAV